MREIKFRAWSSRLGIMSDYVTAIQNGDTQGTPSSVNVIVNGNNETWDIEHNNVILEQFTGLKDKNGKEIFKGSLVKYTEEDGESFIAEVKYFAKDGYPAFDVEPPNEFDFESNVLSVGVANNCLEVVGDIHNNHDLLEVSE